MSDMERLEPCPFCGELPEMTEHFKMRGHWGLVHRCRIIGSISWDFLDKDLQVRKWNTRHGHAELVRENERLRDSYAALMKRYTELLDSVPFDVYAKTFDSEE